MLIVADARRLPLRDSCVSAVVTSPPYWGLRDYGSADQIGVERTPDAYVANLVAVFAEVWRVLKGDGTVWLNLGDSYYNADKWGGGGGNVGMHTVASDGTVPSWAVRERKPLCRCEPGACGLHPGLSTCSLRDLKPKDLVGIPWRVAFALQADGWWLRSDIVWHKPNPMPESITDRPTKAHEYLFLLAKSERYYYDSEAIKETSVDPESFRGRNVRNADKFAQHDHDGMARTRAGFAKIKAGTIYATRNARTVWTIPTMPYSGAHFATMPEALVEPCILAGCPVGGLVCDPFVGSGTVGAVAERLGRRWVGTDLSYQPLATARTAQRGLRW